MIWILEDVVCLLGVHLHRWNFLCTGRLSLLEDFVGDNSDTQWFSSDIINEDFRLSVTELSVDIRYMKRGVFHE